MTITINNRNVSSTSRTINVVNGRVFAGDSDVTPENEKTITIVLHGDVDKIKVDACQSIEVHGNAGSVSTQAGDVKVDGTVSGNVSTGAGNVSIDGDAGGDVSTGAGDVKIFRRKEKYQ